MCFREAKKQNHGSEVSNLVIWPHAFHKAVSAFHPVFTEVSQDFENADQQKNASNQCNSSRVEAFSINPDKKMMFLLKTKHAW